MKRWAPVVLASLCAPAVADVEAGVTAYQRGDYASAFAEFTAAARQSDPLALNVLGIMYAEGRNVERNDKIAVDLFFQAQILGSLEASANLGRMYADGRGVPQSNSEALKHFRDAALGGYLPAMKRLAEIHEKGELGLAPDPLLAQEWRARLGGTPTGLMHRPAPVEPPTPLAKPRENRREAPAPKVIAAAPKPAKPDISVRTPLARNDPFEKQVLDQLEKYRHRERKLQVASTDTSPALATYLKDLRGRLTSGLADASVALKSQSGMTISLSVLKDGSLRSVEMERGSGNPTLDRKVLAALKQLGRFAPLPTAMHEAADVLEVTVRLPIE